MRNSALVTILASAAVASAQVTVNNNGTYTCSKPNAAFCAGDSMGTDIIIRCDATGNGQPGRCSDNLAGEPPVGDSTALCYQSDATSGDAACEKNCVVYADSGSSTLPASLCTPTYTATTSGTASQSTVKETTTSTITSCSGGCPDMSSHTVVTETTSCPTSKPYSNTTITTSSKTTGSATASTTKTTAVVSTTTGGSGATTVPTAGAAANVAGVVLAGLGMAAAFLL